MTKFQIQTALAGSSYAKGHAPMQLSQPRSAAVRQPVRTIPWWRVVLDWISGFGATVPVQPVPVIVAEVPAPAPVIPAPRAIGASPTHYRAFSLLQPRIISDDRFGGPHKAIAAFRERAKSIKLLKDQQINDAACAVLDTFVELVDAFTPLWDAAGKDDEMRLFQIGTGARMGLRSDMLETVGKLDAELARVLSGETRSRDRFETVQRFVEIRYGDAKDDYGLAPV
jgi:hypothetical protein